MSPAKTLPQRCLISWIETKTRSASRKRISTDGLSQSSVPSGITVPNSTLDRIPEPLLRLLAEGGTTFRCYDGDWEVKIELPASGSMRRALPPSSLIIANNGCGDFLFVICRDSPNSEPGSSRDPVFVYWHDEAEIREFKDDLSVRHKISLAF